MKKADHTYRFITDFRKLNSHIQDMYQALPSIDDLILTISLQKPKFFSKIDLKSGFFQLELHPDCRTYTAFSTPTGHLQFRRLPKG